MWPPSAAALGADVLFGLTLLEAEAGNELPIPAIAFGVIGFGLLILLLLITMAIGKGRPHS